MPTSTTAAPPAHTNAALVPLTDLAALRAAGLAYPETVDGWRWLYRNRDARGMKGAFRRIGRRILVDVPAYLAAVRAQPEA